MADGTTAGNARPCPPTARSRTSYPLACFAALLVLGSAARADQPWIESRAELDRWLASEPADSPLKHLSPGARERYLYSLRFSAAGVSGADGSDLSDELSQDQIHAVLSLFGPEVAKHAPPSLQEEVRTVERNVRRRDTIGDVERRYTDYFKARQDIDSPETDVRTRLTAEAFEAHVEPLYTTKNLMRADDRELRLLRRAAEDVALKTRAPRHVEAFRDIFTERERRKLVSSGDLDTMQSLLLSLHRLGEARQLHEKYPRSGMTPLPSFRDSLGKSATGTTVWRVDANGRRLTRELVDLSGTRILVTASCHLSKDALRDIQADAKLGPVFARQALWLAEAPGIESVEAARDWNREFPSTPIFMIYDRTEWSLLPRWRMPEFYVVRDGQVVDSASGWERGSAAHHEALTRLLERNGLL
jgi:hypothetical protein